MHYYAEDKGNTSYDDEMLKITEVMHILDYYQYCELKSPNQW